jgi:hypothetical protein
MAAPAGVQRGSRACAQLAAAAAALIALGGAGGALAQDAEPAEAGRPVAGTPSLPNRDAGLDSPKWMRDSVSNHVAVCWRLPRGDPQQDVVDVRVRMTLDSDGAILEGPTLVDAAESGEAEDPYLAAARESVLAAIAACAPYEFLPRDRYEDWREIDITFRFRTRQPQAAGVSP